MATPICAAFRDGASFTPSPVMATISPLAFSALNDPQLLLRYDAREDVYLPGDRCQSGVVERSQLISGEDVQLFDAGLSGDRLPCRRIVSP